MLDKLGLDGVGKAEREAYQYELEGWERFNLTKKEMTLIADTQEYFFPEDQKNQKVGRSEDRGSMPGWLARIIR